MTMMASQITSLTVVYSTVYSDADQRKHQSSASLAFVRGIHRWPVIYLHNWPVTRKMFPFDDVIMTKETTLKHQVYKVSPLDSDAGLISTQHPTWPQALGEEFVPATNDWWMGLWTVSVCRYWGKCMNKCIGESQFWVGRITGFSKHRKTDWSWLEFISTQHLLFWWQNFHPASRQKYGSYFLLWEHGTTSYFTY